MGRFLIVSFVVCVVALSVALFAEFGGVDAAVKDAWLEAIGPEMRDRLALFEAPWKGEPTLAIAPGDEGYRDDVATVGTQYHHYVPGQDKSVIAFDYRQGRKTGRLAAAAYPGRPRRDVADDDLRTIGVFSLLVVRVVDGVGVSVEGAEGRAPFDVRRTADKVRCVLWPGTYTVRSDDGLSSEITLSSERVWCRLTADGLVGKTRHN